MNDRQVGGAPFADEAVVSPARPAGQLDAPALVHDLDAELTSLRATIGQARSGRATRALVKRPDFRLLLVALRQGARLDSHQAPGAISIHVLSGRLRLALADQTLVLPAGSVLSLAAGLVHDVEALEASAFLLTIAWPVPSTPLAAEDPAR